MKMQIWLYIRFDQYYYLDFLQQLFSPNGNNAPARKLYKILLHMNGANDKVKFV
jgi:hypothetical protein